MKKRSRILSLILSGAMLISSQAGYCYASDPVSGDKHAELRAEADELYVSPKGNDSNPGTADAPLLTVAAARDYVRGINQNMERDIVVYLDSGFYPQEKTLVFSKEDSGTNGHQITYQAWGDGQTVISGGRRLDGWELADNEKGIYKAVLDNVSEDFDTRQLYVNGNRAVRAKGSLPGAAFYKSFGVTTSNLEMLNWKNPKNIEFVFFSSWTSPRVLVDSIQADPTNSSRLKITMNPYLWNEAANKGYTSVNSVPRWIENAYELLDEPGEWYLDKSGAVGGEKNTFYYKPLKGEDMGSAEVIVPMLEELIRIESDNIDEPAGNLQFEGIAFRHATWLRPNQIGGVSDAQDNNIREKQFQGDKATGGNIYLNCTQNVVFSNCEFSAMGNAAIYMHQGNKNNLVTGCHFFGTSAQAIKIGDVSYQDKHNFYLPHTVSGPFPGDEGYYTQADWDWRYVQSNNDVINNVIHDTGLEFFSSSAIGIAAVEESDISHNEIYDIPYAGIHIGYGWGDWKDLMSPAGKNKIQYNYIHDCMEVLIDAGAIYANGSQYGTSGEDGWARATIISDNYIKNQKNLFGALYFDDGADYYEATRNVVQNTPMFATNKHPRNNIHHNYSNQTYYTNSAAKYDNWVNPDAVRDNTWVSGNDFPDEAQEIMKAAGTFTRADLTVENISTDDETILKLTVSNLQNIPASAQGRFKLTLPAETSGDAVLSIDGEDTTIPVSEDGLVSSDLFQLPSASGVTLEAIIRLPLGMGSHDVQADLMYVLNGKEVPLNSQKIFLQILPTMDTAFELNLDSYELGNIPADNPDGIVVNTTAQNTVTVSEVDGEKAIEFHKTANGSEPSMIIPISNIKGFLDISFQVKGPASSTIAYTFQALDGNLNQALAQALHRDGKINYFDASGKPAYVGAYPVNEWQDIRLLVDPTKKTFSIYLNGQLLSGSIPYRGETLTQLTSGFYRESRGQYYLKDIVVKASSLAQAKLSVNDISEKRLVKDSPDKSDS